MKEEKIKVLALLPMELPKEIDLDNTLEAMQKFVGGLIECITLSDTGSEVTLVCNDEGKLLGLPLNRPLWDGADVLAGPGFLAGCDNEGNLTSLPQSAMDFYKEKFRAFFGFCGQRGRSIEFAVLQKNRQPMQHRVTGSVQIQNGQTVAFDFIPVSVAIVVDANAPLFTLKALLLCAVPLFQSSSSDLAADYNVSLCGQNGNPAAYGALHGDEVSLHSLQLQKNHRMQAEAVCGHIHQTLSGYPKDPFRPD